MFYCAKWEIGNFGKQSFIECPNGKPISIPGFEQYHFFIHRELLPGGLYANKNWRISEATTGLLCGGNAAPTIQECIDKTQKILNTVGKDNFPKYVSNAMKSPYKP